MLQKVGDKVTPPLEEIEIFNIHHQVHAIEEHAGRSMYVVSRPRAFDFKMALFRKPFYMKSGCANVECKQDIERVHAAAGAEVEAANNGSQAPRINRRGRIQCTCRSVYRDYDDLKFTLVLENEDGTPVPNGPNGEAPLNFSKPPGTVEREDNNYSTVACGTFIPGFNPLQTRFRKENFEAWWRVKMGDHVWSRSVAGERKLYQLRVVPSDPDLREKYPALSYVSELLLIKRH